MIKIVKTIMRNVGKKVNKKLNDNKGTMMTTTHAWFGAPKK